VADADDESLVTGDRRRGPVRYGVSTQGPANLAASLGSQPGSPPMPLRVQPCRACGRDIVLLPTLARAWWPFEARSLPRERVAPRDRWVLRRRPLAVVPVDDESSARVLARHYCSEYQIARLRASTAVADVVSSVAAKQ